MTFQMTRWNPVRDLAALEIDGLNRMFEAAFSGDVHSAWVPPVDVVETEGHDLVITADLPGLKKDAIKLTVENNVLTLEGERVFDAAPGKEAFYCRERLAGAFRRSFALPISVDSGKVSAAYTDGVLTITLPRREDTRPRQISVNG